MTWYNIFSTFELILIITFIALYALYIRKMYVVNKILKVRFRSLLIKIFVRTVYFSLFIISLLGPSLKGITKEIAVTGKDIIICVDLSASMNSTDILPTRLERIKLELRKIYQAFGTDRIGVIMFSSEAYVACPLTYDQNALLLFTDGLSSNLVPNTGTDFAPPLSMAVEKLLDEKNTTQQISSKVIVLISDGEDFGTKTDNVLSKIKSKGIKTFTLGIGTRKGGKILMPNNKNKTDQSGQEIITYLEPSSLKKIASQTNGKYFEINDNDNQTFKLIQAIKEIQGELLDVKKIDTKSNIYYYFLLVAFIFFMLDVLIRQKVVEV